MTAPVPATLAAPGSRVSDLLDEYPVTAGLVLLLLTVALASGTLVHSLSPAALAAVGTGVGRPLYRLVTSVLWCSGPGCVATVGLAVLLAPTERRLGSRLTLLALVVGQLVATVCGLGVIRLLASRGDAWATELSGMVVVGPLAGLLAVAGLATARMSALWRRRVRLALSIILAALVLYSGTTADVVRLIGWLCGLSAGALLRHGSSASTAH